MKRNKVYVLGITGGIGSGKSLVLDYLSDKYGCLLIKADDLGNEVKLKGNECYKNIVELLGNDILSLDGEIDKKKMAERIFNDSSLIEEVNDIIHPAVRKRIEDIIDKAEEGRTVIIEAALLVEADYFPILNELWEIRSDKEIRIERLMNSRGYSFGKCESIISAQHDSSFYLKADKEYREKNKRNDYFGLRIIDNNSSKEDLYLLIDKAMEEIYGRI